MEFDREYFEAEVRDGFYVTAEMKQAWAAQLEVLNDFDKACRENGLEYYADWGTMLGAVRHGGFIPWDDDIDVCMKRPDYDKFLKIAKKIMPDGYDIYNLETDEHSDNMLTRLINAKRVGFDEERLKKFHGFPYVAGIDISPLGFIPTQKEDADFQKNLVRIVNSVARLYRKYEKEENESLLVEIKSYIGQIEKMCAIKLDWKRNFAQQLNMLLDRLCGLYREDECEYIGNIIEWMKSGKMIYPKDYYNNIVRMPFENITIPVPKQYDKILTELYGDYHVKVHNCDSHEYPFFQEARNEIIEYGVNIPHFALDMKEYKNFINQENTIRNFRKLASIDTEKKRTVLFMPFKAKYWKTMQPLWEKYSQIEDIDVLVMPMHYYYRNINGTVEQYVEEDEYPKELHIVSLDEYNFEKDRPVEIVFQNPYDECNVATTVHPIYYSKNLLMHTDKLTYIPYFTTEEIAEDDMRADASMNEYVTMPGVVYSDRVILQSENIKKLYVRKLVEFYGEDTRNEWESKLCTTF